MPFGINWLGRRVLVGDKKLLQLLKVRDPSLFSRRKMALGTPEVAEGKRLKPYRPTRVRSPDEEMNRREEDATGPIVHTRVLSTEASTQTVKMNREKFDGDGMKPAEKRELGERRTRLLCVGNHGESEVEKEEVLV